MNKDQVKGTWKQFVGKVKQKWGKLTDDELIEADGDVELICGKIQEKYGTAKEETRKSLEELREAI